jgi:tyramine---L-glutamate ligase
MLVSERVPRPLQKPPMKILVYEHLCGGGWPEEALYQSLILEGGAMLQALCEDLSRLPDVEVTATLDVRSALALPAGVNAVPVDSAVRGREELFHHAALSDAVFVIAPELDNLLARLVHELRKAGAKVVAPPDKWLELCSSKSHLASFCSSLGIPTIPTCRLEQNEPHELQSAWAVIKPDFGAGSHAISVLPAGEVEKLRTPPQTPPVEALIVQPYIPGTALSVGAVANSLGQRTLLPIARQFLSDDACLKYEGGSIPWNGPAADRILEIVRRCCEAMPGLVGYVGFDFVLPDADPDSPLLVEINPRLCTSYLGYRRLTGDNLSALMLPNWPRQPVRWEERAVSFRPDGTFELTAVAE